jgi:3',5'-cyclic AMP phosphodiesterase CpdA
MIKLSRLAGCCFAVIIFLTSLNLSAIAADEKPLCTIAILGSTHITALPAADIRETAKKGKKGKSRSWLKKVASIKLGKAIEMVNEIKPDALLIIGSLTWTGSKADYKELENYIKKIKCPVYLTGGTRDRIGDPDGKIAAEIFKDKYFAGKSIAINGVFMSPPGALADKSNISTGMDVLEKEFIKAKNAKAVFALEEYDLSVNRITKWEDYRKLLLKYKTVMRIVSGRSHKVRGESYIPAWSPPLTGWSGGIGCVGLASVFSDKVEMSVLKDVKQPPITFTQNNPVTTKRTSDIFASKYKLPQYKEDLDKNPELTFAQISDPQIGFRGAAARDEQYFKETIESVNLLQPSIVFVTGDLVDKNLPDEWDRYTRVTSLAKVPLRHLPGNHDTSFLEGGIIAEKDRDNAKLVQALAEKVKADGDAVIPYTLFHKFTGEKDLRFTVIKNHCAFISVPTVAPNITDDNLAWLEKELEKTRQLKHVFVLTHYPVHPYFGNNVKPEEGGNTILALLKKYKVAALICGHRHHSNYKLIDSTMHIDHFTSVFHFQSLEKLNRSSCTHVRDVKCNRLLKISKWKSLKHIFFLMIL